MAEEKLRKAFSLMKQGQNKEAVAIVQSILKEDKENVPAWWLMTNLLADDPERQKKSLERVLALDPKHKLALQLKSKLEGGGSAPKASTSSQKPQQQAQANSNEEVNLDWGKLDARDANKKTEDESSSSKTVQIVTYGMIGFVLIIAIIIGAMWAVPAYQFSLINNPENTILRFYDAYFQGDTTKARTLVCPSEQADFDAVASVATDAANALREQFGEGVTVTFDFSGLTAEEVTNDGTNATVRLSGEITLTAGEESHTEPVASSDENLEELRLENGVWCVAKVQ